MFRTFACSTAFAVLLFVTPQTQTAPDPDLESGFATHRRHAPHRAAAGTGSRGRQPRLAAQHRGLSRRGSPVGSLQPSVTIRSRPPGVRQLRHRDGITTELGTFIGIGQDSVSRKQLIKVTRSFDELLGPAGGWTFLVTSSVNHGAARALALRSPRCANASSALSLPADVPVDEVAAAYLAGDNAGMLRHADPERLTGLRPNLEPVTVGGVAVCGGWGSERLAFVTVNASYQADTSIGHASLLLAFRKTSSLWRLLVATRDPVSNRQFVALLPAFSRALARDIPADPVPAPATLRSPGNGRFPLPAKGARFGDFVWQASASEDVVAEIAEFSYHDEARLVLLRSLNPGEPRTVSSGQLWTTGGEWAWRVWSITRSGEIAFSEVRTFVH